jgi:predicted  nucleic acid-binding Zn-ribbon protein
MTHIISNLPWKDLIDYDSLKPEEAEKNLKLAWDIAENVLGIENYLDYKDILAVARPEPKTMTMQVYEYYKHFSQKQPGVPFKNSFPKQITTQPTSAFTKTMDSPSKTATTATANNGNVSVVNQKDDTKANVLYGSLTKEEKVEADKKLLERLKGIGFFDKNRKPVKSDSSWLKKDETESTEKPKDSTPTSPITTKPAVTSSPTTTKATTISSPTTTKATTPSSPTTTKSDSSIIVSSSGRASTETKSISSSSSPATAGNNNTPATTPPADTIVKPSMLIDPRTRTYSISRVSSPTSNATTIARKATIAVTTASSLEKKPFTNIATVTPAKSDTSATTSSPIATKPSSLITRSNASEDNTVKKPQVDVVSKYASTATTTQSPTSPSPSTTSVATTSSSIKKEEIDIAKLEKEITELRKELEKAKEQNELLQKTYKSKNDELNKEIQTWRAKSQQLENDANKYKRELEEQKKDLESQKSKAATNQTTILSEKSKLEKDVKNISAEKQKIEKELSDLKLSIQKLEQEKKAVEQKLSNLQSENEKVRKDYNDLLNIMNSGKGADQKAQEQIKKLEEQLKRTQSEKADLEKERNKLKEDLRKAELAKTNAEKTLNEQIQCLQKEVTQLKADKLNLEKTLSEKEKVTASAAERARKMTITSADTKVSNDVSNLERWVIDQAVLFAQPVYMESHLGTKKEKIPVAAKILFLTLKNWDKYAYPKNLVTALRYTIQKYRTDRIMLAYWMNTLIRLLHMLGQEYRQQDLVLKSVLASKVASDILSSDNDSFVNEKYFIPPPSFTSDGGYSITLLIPELASLLDLTYVSLLKTLIIKLDAAVHNAMFDAYDLGQDYDGEAAMDKITMELDTALDELQHEYNVDQRIVLHYFACIGKLLDVMVFNNCISHHKKLAVEDAIQIKMNISFLEAWFFESKLTMGENIVSIFSFSRQLADVCVLGQEDLPDNKEMRDIVCPNLSTQQIAYILQSKKVNNASPYFCKHNISLVGYTEPKNWVHINDEPVFIYDDLSSTLDIEIPSSFKHKDIKFLEDAPIF